MHWLADEYEAWLNIDSIENTNKGKDTLKSGWKELVIPERFRELLLSVVNNHVSGTQTRPWETSDRRHPNDQMDLIRGKGRGLVVLLHGKYRTFLCVKSMLGFSRTQCQS